jgi:ABC-type glycerol-3-phosphate transport system permease component
MASMIRQKRIKQIFVNSAVLVVSFVVVFPLLWILFSTFKSEQEMFSLPIHWLPEKWTLEHYRKMWDTTAYQIKNSLLVSSSVTVLAVCFATFGGYSLARFRYPGNQTVGLSILATQMFPGIMFIVPIIIILKQFRLTSTYTGLIIAYLSFALPFGTWMMRNYFRTIPMELEEAALIDGCNRLGAIFRIILPLSMPGIGATVVFTFLLSWRDFMMATQLLPNQAYWTIPVGVVTLIGRYDTGWGPLLAGSLFVAIPVMILFCFLQKLFIEGMTTGGVKA